MVASGIGLPRAGAQFQAKAGETAAGIVYISRCSARRPKNIEVPADVPQSRLAWKTLLPEGESHQ
jgi:hypothetical protein